MHEINRLLMAIMAKSDTARPFYELIAALEGLSYENAKNKVMEEVMSYIKKGYEIRKHFNGNGDMIMEKYLKEPDVMMEVVSFLINRFAKDINSLHELIKVIYKM